MMSSAKVTSDAKRQLVFGNVFIGYALVALVALILRLVLTGELGFFENLPVIFIAVGFLPVGLLNRRKALVDLKAQDRREAK